MRTHSQSRRRSRFAAGFTLIEIVIVILVVLILAGLTMAVVGDVIDGDRVRGGASTVQNYLAGARDRAIYAASRQEGDTQIPPAIGVRFLPDPSFIVPDPARPPANKLLAFGSMVFVQEVEPLPTWLRVIRNVTPPRWEASQLTQNGVPLDNLQIRSARALIDRGLVNSRMEYANPITGAAVPDGIRVYYLPVQFDNVAHETYFVRFIDAPTASGGSLDGPWLSLGLLSKAYGPGGESSAADQFPQEGCRLRLLPAAMPSEEPRPLPEGTVIDVESSFVAGVQVQDLLRSDGSFDILFNSRGIVEGPLAAAGLVHLVIADAEDVERGFRVNSPFVDTDGTAGPDDTDGDGSFDERQGEELIVSVRTQTGSVYVSDLNPVLQTAPGDPLLRADPFAYAETGGEAR